MLKLRRIEESDLRSLFNMRNDPRVFQWCRQFAPLHWEKHLDWYHWQAKDPSTEMFIILHYDPERKHLHYDIGACGLTSIDHASRRAEFSLYIDPNYQGKGHGKTALSMLLDFGFKQLNLNRIWGESFDGNPAIKMFEGLGFKKEGTRKEFYYRDGEYVDAHLYSIGKTEWLL